MLASSLTWGAFLQVVGASFLGASLAKIAYVLWRDRVGRR